MTTSEKATLQMLIAETVMAESGLSGAQTQLSGAMKARDAANKRLTDFMDNLQPSDAPQVKRAYVRKAKALLDSAPNAAQPTVEAVRERLQSGADTMFNDEGRQS